ncbi:MAG: hypothetical protein A2133_02635 [Actinobacteria bacterium RBG_16_64_13]|nr:MAG: hypothetical protein A2133_02635 [Actinobacteria bacterium RBG_16_64_13]
MTKRNRYLLMLVVAVALVALTLGLASAAMATSLHKLTVGAGETYVVGDVTTLQYLSIAPGGVVKAAAGFSVTMTIDGVETGGDYSSTPTGIFDPPPPFAPPGSPDSERYLGESRIKPGTYRGNIVLTPTQEMLLPRGAPFPAGNEPFEWPYRTGLYIDDSGLVQGKSVLAAVKGTVTRSAATNLEIVSTGDYFNGVMFMGDSNYVLQNSTLEFTGNGHDDFGGFGAAIRVAGTSNVVINKAKIVTDGVTRSAVWVGGEGTVTVNDSRLVTGLGILPADWLGGPFPPGTGGSMLTVPWMLGISGNCRATSVVGKGTATYNNCYIEAQQWGALSTDMCQDGHLTAVNCTIKVVESGYGAYSDQQVDDYFDKCRFDVPDYGVIMTGPGTTTFTNGSVVDSDRWGMMFHGGAPGTVEIDKGTAFNTGLTCFLMKNSYPTLNIDNAQLNPGNGIILHAMFSDDPMSPDQSGGDTNIDANFSNMSMKGDIVNTMTAKGNVNVALSNATIAGAITTGTQELLGTYPRSIDARQDIGMVKATYAATTDPYGVKVTLNAGGKWVVTKTSYLTSLTFTKSGQITAPAGYKLSLTVNGKPKLLKPGTYTGALMIKVSPLTAFGAIFH